MAMVMMLMVLVVMVLTMGTMTVAVTTTTKAMMSTCLHPPNIYPMHERYICPTYERADSALASGFAPRCLSARRFMD